MENEDLRKSLEALKSQYFNDEWHQKFLDLQKHYNVELDRRTEYFVTLEENKRLKTLIKQHDEFNNMNELVLLRAENISLKTQNLRIIKKYKKWQSDSPYFSDSESDYDEHQHTPASSINNELHNYGIVIQQLQIKRRDRAADGFFHIDGIPYELLEGTRTDVWNGKAYQTAGGLIKTDLLINKNGKIVSKSKSIDGIINNKLDIVNQLRKIPRITNDSL